MTRAIVIAFVFCACRGGEQRKQPPTTAGSAGSATAAAAPADASIDPTHHDFCVRSMEQIKKCFEDEAFWDAHATTFFAARKQPIDPDAKKRWIGMYKDSFVSLVRNKELAQNCDAMLAENQLPTKQQIDLVDHAREQSCAAFGAALGYVIYGEGAFYKPREGFVPSTLELAPSP